MSVGEKLKEARKTNGLTQRELGKKVGVSAAVVGQHETGARNPKFETIKRYAQALNMPLSSFLEV